MMQKKVEQTRAETSPYPLRDPFWEINIEMRSGDRSLSITMKATDPDAMERAAELLSAQLNSKVLTFDRDKHWSIQQTLDDVTFNEVLLDDGNERRP